MQELPRFCEEGGETALTTVKKVIELALDCTEAKCKKKNLLEWNTDLQAERLGARAAGLALRCQVDAAENQVITLERRLVNAGAGRMKLASTASQAKANL